MPRNRGTRHRQGMSRHIPDGEYELDFSGLFSSLKSDVFGIKYGFKQDSVDLDVPSVMYKDHGELHGQANTTDIPCYLVAESKVNERAITTNIGKDDHVYFEGRCKASPLHDTPRPMAHSASHHGPNGDPTPPAMAEYLMCYDDVSKCFKIDTFDGFIRMNKSREPGKVSEKISKMKRAARDGPKKKEQRDAAPSYVDILLSSLSKCNPPTSKKAVQSPVSSTFDLAPNHARDEGKSTPYGKLLNDISPVRKSKALLSRPLEKTLSPATTLSAATTLSPPSHSPSRSPVRSPTHSPGLPPAVSNIPSPRSAAPISRSSPLPTVKPPVPSSNGGMGFRKTQKSLLLRKAERAIGINKGSGYKPKVREPSSLSKVPKNVADQVVDSLDAKLHETKGLRIRKQTEKRELKEARPDQTSFELNLVPPVDINPVGKRTMPQSPTEKRAPQPAKDTKVDKRDPTVEESILSDEDLENFTEEIESEMEAVKPKKSKGAVKKEIPKAEKDMQKREKTSDQSGKRQEDTILTPEEKDISHLDQLDIGDGNETVVFPKKRVNSKLSDNADSPKESRRESVEHDNPLQDDDSQIEFSDWEDADAIDGPVLSDDNELTNGNSDFNLIIEDDPFKFKRENEKEMQERRKREKEEEIRFEQELQRRERDLKSKAAKPAKRGKSAKTSSKKSSAATVLPNNDKIQPVGAKHKPEKHEPQDIELDKELDEELDRAFDDLLDEEDMSEEE